MCVEKEEEKKKNEMESESELSAVKNCRVCGETGAYDLWEMHFRYNSKDVPLIEAFNSFSMLDNVSVVWNASLAKICAIIILEFVIDSRTMLISICVKRAPRP